jgi:hypothetical protein
MVATLFGTILLVAAVPAVASAASCGAGGTAHPFKQFGDNANYKLLEGGSFESATSGWSLTNASVVGENESYNVEGGGSHSLEIGAGGSAVSPLFCLNVELPTFRFFERGNSTLSLALRWTTPSGFTREWPLGSVRPDSDWSPSPIVRLSSVLPFGEALLSVKARLIFRAGGEGPVKIDDVYVDPYSR